MVLYSRKCRWKCWTTWSTWRWWISGTRRVWSGCRRRSSSLISCKKWTPMAWNRWIQCWRTGGQSQQPLLSVSASNSWLLWHFFLGNHDACGPFAQNDEMWFCVGQSCHWYVKFLCVSKAKVNFSSLICLNCHAAPQMPASGASKHSTASLSVYLRD